MWLGIHAFFVTWSKARENKAEAQPPLVINSSVVCPKTEFFSHVGILCKVCSLMGSLSSEFSPCSHKVGVKLSEMHRSRFSTHSWWATKCSLQWLTVWQRFRPRESPSTSGGEKYSEKNISTFTGRVCISHQPCVFLLSSFDFLHKVLMSLGNIRFICLADGKS